MLVLFMSDFMSGHVLKCLKTLKSCLSSLRQPYKFAITGKVIFYPGQSPPNADRNDLRSSVQSLTTE